MPPAYPTRPEHIQSNESLIDPSSGHPRGELSWDGDPTILGWNYATSIETGFFPPARPNAPGSDRNLVLGAPVPGGPGPKDQGEAGDHPHDHCPSRRPDRLADRGGAGEE